MHKNTRCIITVLLCLSLLMIAPLGFALADTGLGDWLDRMPGGDTKTARAIAEHLNGQWAVIRRDETARGVVEYETGALDKTHAAMVAQETARAEAETALADAQSAADEAALTRENIKEMRAIQYAYEAALRAYNLAIKAEQSTSAVLDKVEDDLYAAQSQAEDANHELEEQSEAFDSADAYVKTLSTKVLDLEELGESDKADSLAAAKADLSAAERTLSAFAKQLAQYKEQAAHAQDTAAEAESKYNKAFETERAALDRLESAKLTLDDAKTAFEALQLTDDELDSFEEEARVSVLRTQAAMDAALTIRDQAIEELDKLSAELTEAEGRYETATAEATAALTELNALRLKWNQYSACIGAVSDTYPMPAMDLLAQMEAAPELYAVYLNGTRLYLFRPTSKGAASEPFLSAVLKEKNLTVELTRNGKGIMSLRYIGVDGKTHLQSLGKDSSALMTGTYPVLKVDSQLRGMTQYLGEAGEVNTTSMHGLTTLVQFGIDNPIRHEARPQ
ncbi:hypothetical protein FACS1894184_07140 [Clostridia bacterium]|nr:hypothetical protein FACS1894184_07140 [Clostridia bacterium]